MTASTIGVVIAAVLGGGGISAVLSAVLSKRSMDATAMRTWSTVWNENLNLLREEVGGLRERVTALEQELAVAEGRNRILAAILVENRIDLPD